MFSVPSRTKKKMADDFIKQFLRVEKRFLKAPFSWRISVDGGPNRKNKALFSWRISVDSGPNRRKA